MLILDSTNKSLRVRLDGAHVTGPLRCVTSYRNMTDSTFIPANTMVNTNGATAVELVPPPSASNYRVIDFISVLNTDTANQNVTIYQHDGTTNFDIIKVTLSPNERVEYSEGNGFGVFNSAGSLKTLTQATQNVVSTGWSTTVLGADVTNAEGVANTIRDITGLSFPVVSGVRYWFEFMIWYTVAATTTGSRFTVNGPTSPTALIYRSEYSLTTSTKTNNEQLGTFDLPAAANATSAYAAPAANIALVRGFVQPSADGTVIGRFASELAGIGVTAKQGSIVSYIAAV